MISAQLTVWAAAQSVPQRARLTIRRRNISTQLQRQIKQWVKFSKQATVPAACDLSERLRALIQFSTQHVAYFNVIQLRQRLRPTTPPADPKYLQHLYRYLYSYLVSSHPLTTLAWLWLTLYPSSSPHYPLEIETFYPIKRQAHFHLSYSHELRSEMIYSSHVRISYIEYQKTVQSSSVAVW